VSDDKNPHPQEHSSAGHNRIAVGVDLRRGQVRKPADPSEFRDAVQAAREGQKQDGVTVLTKHT
jgi:hypothetical protein